MAGDPDVWKLLYDEQAAQKAQNLIASAFGADQDPAVLVNELEQVATWLVEGDGDAIARRVVSFVAAMTMFGRRSLDAYATALVEAIDNVEEADPERLRNQAFDLLGEYAAQLRALAAE